MPTSWGRNARALPLRPHGPVRAIAISGYGMDHDVKKSREVGFLAHLTKPIEFPKLLAQIEEDILRRALGATQPGAARVWRDTQLSSAGTLFNVLSGKVRWAHDFRPYMARAVTTHGATMSLCAHPYDLCTAPLLCAALGVVLLDPSGAAFTAPMAIDHDVAWCAYANQALVDQLQPHVRDTLHALQLVPAA